MLDLHMEIEGSLGAQHLVALLAGEGGPDVEMADVGVILQTDPPIGSIVTELALQ